MAKGSFAISAYGWIIFVIIIFVIVLALVTTQFIPEMQDLAANMRFGL